MENLDLNNPEHRTAIQEVLRQGAKGEFWNLICQRINTSIDAIQSQRDSGELENLVAEEYKIRSEVLRKQKVDRQDILAIPKDLVRELDNPEFFARNREEEVYLDKEDFENK